MIKKNATSMIPRFLYCFGDVSNNQETDEVRRHAYTKIPKITILEDAMCYPCPNIHVVHKDLIIKIKASVLRDLISDDDTFQNAIECMKKNGIWEGTVKMSGVDYVNKVVKRGANRSVFHENSLCKASGESYELVFSPHGPEGVLHSDRVLRHICRLHEDNSNRHQNSLRMNMNNAILESDQHAQTLSICISNHACLKSNSWNKKRFFICKNRSQCKQRFLIVIFNLTHTLQTLNMIKDALLQNDRILKQYIPSNKFHDVIEADSLERLERLSRSKSKEIADLTTTPCHHRRFYPSFQHHHRIHENTFIIFMDIINFTSLTSHNDPGLIFSTLGSFFGEIDSIVLDTPRARKIEIAGDSYIIAIDLGEGSISNSSGSINKIDSGSSLQSRSNSADSKDEQMEKGKTKGSLVLKLARHIINAAYATHVDPLKLSIDVRLGIHMGTVISGIIGTYQPKLTLIGEPMIVSSRLQSTSLSNGLHFTKEIFNKYIDYELRLTKSDNNEWIINERSDVDLKGLGSFKTICLQPKHGYESTQN